MKEVIVGLFLVSFILLGAVNPGLPKDDLKFIKQFRLPAWKYSGFGLTLNGNGENTGFTIDNSYRRFENYGLILSPNVQGRRESETEILEYNGDLNMYYNYLRHYHYYYWDMGKRIERTVNINPFFKATLKKYQYGNSYFNMETDLNYNYMHIYEDKYNENNDRSMSVSLTIGFGNGKVREVTPVIRALRFKQRYNSLGKDKLSQQEVADLAKIMAKYSGYNYTYDRSEKYFWNEAFSVLGDKITGLNGYETFMITDAMKEVVGTRLQGSEFNVNIKYIWMDYNGDYDFEDYTTAYIGLVMNARTYENLSVSHQAGFEIYIGYFIPTSDVEPFENMFNCWLNHNQLFTITDRLLYQVDFNFYGDIFTYSKISENKGIRLEALNNFSYYLENNLSLNLNADVHFQKYDHQISDNSSGYYYYPPNYYYGTYREYLWWDFGISLNYYFRKM